MNGTTETMKTGHFVWRWHFYAGLIVAPFLVVLALTGMIYLFNDEINDALYPHLHRVVPGAVSVQTTDMVRAALRAQPGALVRIDLPGAPDRAAVVFIQPEAGARRLVYVNPYTGEALGSLVYERTLVGWADAMHGSLMMGEVGDRIVELAACWALVLIVTGLCLWWPRGLKGPGGVLYPRLWGRGRMLWRDLHAVTGMWAALLIVFLILSGLPWAGVQGKVLKDVTAWAGIGYPASNRTYGAPKSVPMKDALGEAPWTLEDAPMPRSATRPDPHAGHPGYGRTGAPTNETTLAGLDMIVFHLSEHGLTGGYRLFLPDGPQGVYTAYTYPDRPEGQRTLYFDRYSHRLIREVSFADYGWAAKLIELGVQLHMGNYFGPANQALMLMPCLAILFLVFSGVVMWWKRRPQGQRAAPPVIDGAKMKVALGVLIVAGALLPVLGVSLIAVAVTDRVVTCLARRRRAA